MKTFLHIFIEMLIFGFQIVIFIFCQFLFSGIFFGDIERTPNSKLLAMMFGIHLIFLVIFLMGYFGIMLIFHLRKNRVPMLKIFITSILVCTISVSIIYIVCIEFHEANYYVVKSIFTTIVCNILLLFAYKKIYDKIYTSL